MSRVLVTGSSGHLAQTVTPALQRAGHTVVPFDLPEWDILDRELVQYAARKADQCIHLAGMKYADRGELEPLEAVNVNVHGTQNVIDAFGANAVIASTCKAADPETVYGCSKLIAERVALSAGARVVRFVNVLGSAGSVTEIWDAVPADQPLPVCNATRLFITAEQAADLIVSALGWPAGRYGPMPGEPRTMISVAIDLYPGRQTISSPLRRGDRRHERLLAACEHATPWGDSAVRIHGQHDPQHAPTLVEAVVAAVNGEIGAKVAAGFARGKAA